MAVEWVILIGVASFWVVGLLVLGFLALTYQNQHRPLVEKRKKYYQDWNQIKATIDLNRIFSHPIKINFQLPDQEKIYYLDIENPVYIFSQKTKEYKMLLKFEGKKPTIYENYFDDLDLMSLRSGYKLHRKKIKSPIYVANIYITNFRIMLHDLANHQSHQILFSKIKKAYIAMIFDQGAYNRGYIIQTENELYEIVSDEPSAVLIINQILRKEQEKNERK